MKLTILDGAMGTELQRRGVKTKLPLWSGPANIEDSNIVREIHMDYARAGADIITTNTFRTNVRPWRTEGLENKHIEATEKAIEIALSVKKDFPDIKVAGSITTIEDCYRPDLVPPDSELDEEHGIQMEIFENSGIDMMFLETMNTIRESEAILNHSKNFNVPIFVSFVTDKNGDLMSGESIEEAIRRLSKYDITGFMLNCRPPQLLTIAAQKLADVYSGTKGIYANGHGEPGDELGWEFNKDFSPKEYLEYVEKWYDMGFEMIGGCCGTTPEHIMEISKFKNQNSK